MKRVFSRVIQGVFLSITFVLLSLILLACLIQTPFGKEKIVDLTIHYLSSLGIEAKISKLEGILPFDCRIKHLELKLHSEEHVVIENFESSLSFFALFRKEIDFNAIKIGKIEVQNSKLLPKNFPLALTGKLSLSLRQAELRGSFEGSDLNFENMYLQLSLRGNFSKDQILESGEISCHFFEIPGLLAPGGSLDFQGSLKNHAFSGVISSSSFTIDSFLIPFEAKISFLTDQLQGSLSLKASSGDLPIQGSSAFRLEDLSSIDFSDIEVSIGEDNALSGNLLIDLKTFLLKGNLYATSSNLTNLLPFDWSGKCAVNAEFSKTDAAQNLKLQVAAEMLRLSELRIHSVFLFSELRDIYHDPHGKSDLSLLGLHTPFASVNILNAFSSKEEKMTGWDMHLSASGMIKEDFQVETDFHLNTGSIKLNTFSGDFLNIPITLKSPCEISWDASSYAISPCLIDAGDGSFQGSFSLNAKSLAMTAEMHRFPLPLFSLFSPKFSLGGTVSLTSTLQGDEKHLKGNLEASLEEAVLTNFSQNDPFQAKGSLLANITEENALLHLNLYAKDQQFLEASTTLPVIYDLKNKRVGFSLKKPFSGELTAEGNLEEIFDFVNLGFHHLTGLISAHLLASETLGNPYLQGSIDWTQGSYANYLIGTNLSDVSAHFEAEKDHLHVTQIHAKDASGGTLIGEGDVTLSWKQKIPYTFSFSLSDLNTLDFDILQAKLDGSLYISGSFQSALAQGNLLITKGSFHIPDVLPYDIPTIPITYVNRPETEMKPEPFTSFPFSLDLTVTTPDTVSVEGKGLRSSWKGTLHVTGTNLNLAAGGKLNLVSGDYLFAGKNFKLTEGEIFFVDEKTKTAYIKLKGTLNLSDLEVAAELYGPLTHPTLTFHSNPHMPTSSILARVLFNKDISDINQLEAVQLATTLMSLSSGGGPDILDNIRKSIGVDRLSVTSAGKNGEGVAVQIGKYLTKGVMITLSQSATSTEVIVEVEIGKGFLFQAESQVEGEGKFSLKWRHTY